MRSALPYVERGALVVSAEPTATYAFKVHYPDYLGSSEASLVAGASRDLGELLAYMREQHPEWCPAARPIGLADLIRQDSPHRESRSSRPRRLSPALPPQSAAARQRQP